MNRSNYLKPLQNFDIHNSNQKKKRRKYKGKKYLVNYFSEPALHHKSFGRINECNLKHVNY